MSNLQRGGFRWVRNKYAPNEKTPPIMVHPVASAYGTVLYAGDVVKLLNDGTLAAASAGDTPYGIVSHVPQYYDGTVVRSGGKLPVSTWGSNISRQSRVAVIPVRGQLFEIDCDDATTATTLAGYQAFIQENAEWVAGTAVNDQSGTLLDISGHNTTNTLSVRIEEIPNPETQDFASIGVKLVVSFNLIQDTASGSTTGT